MRIKKRLRIYTGFSLLTVLVIFAVLSMTLYRINRVNRASMIAADITSITLERVILINEYLRNANNRSRVQWLARQEQMNRLLAAAPKYVRDAEGRATIEILVENNVSTGKIFSSIVANRERSGMTPVSAALAREVEDRLLNQMNMRVYETVIQSRKLLASSREAGVAAIRFAGWVVLGVLAVIMALSVIATGAINRTITERVRRLRDGAAIIGAGNMGHRIELAGNDEFAELAEAFNAMTSKLGASRESLNREIEVRGLAEEALHRNLQRFKLLADTSAELLQSREPQKVVDSLCRKVLDALGCHAFFNYLVDETAGKLHLNACAGIPEEEARKIRWLDYGTAVCGCAARDACRIVAEDIAYVPDPRTELVKSYGIKAYACHPLMAQGRVLGTLSFGTRGRSRFSEDDLSLMKAVADQVAIAMERQHVENELRLAKDGAEAANRAKSRFLANMSHELRTPMTGVLGMLEMVLDSRLDREQRENLAMAQRSAASLLGILNDVLDLTKVEAGMLTLEKMPFNLSSCVRGTIDILLPEARRKGLDLTCACEGTLPETAVGDQLRLRQILTNLLGNAVKFTHSGKVELIVRGGDCMSDGRREVTFVVADTGIGIPEDKGQILFKPFTQADESHTRRYGGTGLGLAICRELVERMGGSIGFTSKEGVGTVFTCIVPLGESPSEDTGSLPLPLQPEDAAAAMPHLGGERPRLLVAEDDPVIGHLLVKSLRKLNFRVDNVQDGMQVVEEWLRAEYDLVLMDIQMPRMDGFQATGAIRERERAAGKEGRTIIIAMTAHALKEDEERCLAAGMDAYISKPINLRESIELIKRLLAGKGL